MGPLRMGLLGAATALLGIVATSSTGLADTIISPGKFRAWASIGPVLLNTAPTANLQILKAKKKYVLEVRGMVQVCVNDIVTVYPTVNGILPLVPAGSIDQECSGCCVVSGTWFLDLDAAELANPGVLFSGGAGLPLNVALDAFTPSVANGLITMTAEIKKKK